MKNNIEPLKFGAIGNRSLFDDYEITSSEHQDDNCNIEFSDSKIVIKGERDILEKSLANYKIIKNLSKGHHFENYLPRSMKFDADNNLEIKLTDKAVPLSKIQNLEQIHANWILSRMIEFVALISKFNYTHLGINPDSIYVVPKTHGILPITFYHMKKLGDRIDNDVSNKYYLYYPSNVLSNNKASYFIDFELAKRTIASCMTGSLSPAMKEKYNSDFVDFLLNFNKENPKEVFEKYRKIISNNFEKKFHEFKI